MAPDETIACTLGPDDTVDRLAAWRDALAQVSGRDPIAGGIRLTLSTRAIGPLAELVAAEQECCAFFRFAITVDERGTALEVTAPPDAQELVQSFFG